MPAGELESRLTQLLVDGCEVYFLPLSRSTTAKFTCFIKLPDPQHLGHEALAESNTVDGALLGAIEHGKQEGWL